MESTKPSQKRYQPELKERAIRMVLDLRSQDPKDQGVITRVARHLGVGTDSLRTWVNQAEVNAGNRPGLTTDEQAEKYDIELMSVDRELVLAPAV